jgi:hypothetical protein
MKEFMIEFRLRVSALDADDAVERAEEELAVGNYSVEVEEIEEED